MDSFDLSVMLNELNASYVTINIQEKGKITTAMRNHLKAKHKTKLSN